MKKLYRKCRLFMKVVVLKNANYVDKFFYDNGDTKLRIDYPLSSESIVLDVGGYKGEWANNIYYKYHCNIHVFEPVKEFVNILKEKFSDIDKVKIHSFGLGAETSEVRIFMHDNSSTVYGNISEDNSEAIQIIGIEEFLANEKILKIDLIKINIEGGEFSLLKKMIDIKKIAMCKNLQIQFHEWIENSSTLRNEIRKELSKTHELTYDYPFVWENWSLKE